MPSTTIFSNTSPIHYVGDWLVLMHGIFTENPSQSLRLHEDSTLIPPLFMPPGCLPGSHLVFLADMPLSEQHAAALQRCLYALPKIFQRLYDQLHPQRPIILNANNYASFAKRYLSYDDEYYSAGMLIFERYLEYHLLKKEFSVSSGNQGQLSAL